MARLSHSLLYDYCNGVYYKNASCGANCYTVFPSTPPHTALPLFQIPRQCVTVQILHPFKAASKVIVFACHNIHHCTAKVKLKASEGIGTIPRISQHIGVTCERQIFTENVYQSCKRRPFIGFYTFICFAYRSDVCDLSGICKVAVIFKLSALHRGKWNHFSRWRHWRQDNYSTRGYVS